jgi:hypothetical protein
MHFFFDSLGQILEMAGEQRGDGLVDKVHVRLGSIGRVQRNFDSIFGRLEEQTNGLGQIGQAWNFP